MKDDWKTKKKSIETNKIILSSGEYNLEYINMHGRLILDLYTYFRREYQLSSYKLDSVSSNFICDNIKAIEHIEINNVKKTKIYTKNLKGLY